MDIVLQTAARVVVGEDGYRPVRPALRDNVGELRHEMAPENRRIDAVRRERPVDQLLAVFALAGQGRVVLADRDDLALLVDEAPRGPYPRDVLLDALDVGLERLRIAIAEHVAHAALAVRGKLEYLWTSLYVVPALLLGNPAGRVHGVAVAGHGAPEVVCPREAVRMHLSARVHGRIGPLYEWQDDPIRLDDAATALLVVEVLAHAEDALGEVVRGERPVAGKRYAVRPDLDGKRRVEGIRRRDAHGGALRSLAHDLDLDASHLHYARLKELGGARRKVVAHVGDYRERRLAALYPDYLALALLDVLERRQVLRVDARERRRGQNCSQHSFSFGLSLWIALNNVERRLGLKAGRKLAQANGPTARLFAPRKAQRYPNPPALGRVTARLVAQLPVGPA